VDVWAALGAGRWDATRGLHPEEVRDCQSEAGRDFLPAKAELERPILPEQRVAPESRLAQRPQDELPKAVCQLVPLAVQAQQVGPPRAPLLACADESDLLQAQSLEVPQASPPVARRPVDELGPLERPEQWPWAPRARRALPLARLEPQARLVLLRLALRSIAGPQVSSARPLRLLPSLLFLLWQLLPLGLLLRRRLESFCAPFPQRPRGSSSSASSFP
jgi:hypothetical protein